jgi:hypothetical protein
MTAALAVKKARLIMELRAEGIVDAKVLGAIERTSRELFLPETFRDRAYENVALPIGHGQTISQPLVVAHMTEALQVGSRHKVLEIGTGSGYQTAVLARLCRRVFTMERHLDLLKAAEQRFAALRLHNVTTRFRAGAVRAHHRHRRQRGGTARAAGKPRGGWRAHRARRCRASRSAIGPCAAQGRPVRARDSGCGALRTVDRRTAARTRQVNCPAVLGIERRNSLAYTPPP